MKTKFRRDPRQACRIAGGIAAARMPVQHDVAIVEQPFTHHEYLGRAPFLGRATVKAHGAAAACPWLSCSAMAMAAAAEAAPNR